MGTLAEELDELIKEAGLTVTFDRFRDVTKGCGSHCKAYYPYTSETYCPNHQAAIERGEYAPRARDEEKA